MCVGAAPPHFPAAEVRAGWGPPSPSQPGQPPRYHLHIQLAINPFDSRWFNNQPRKVRLAIAKSAAGY